MLLTALYHYLTYSGEMPGHARDLFEYPQIVDGRTMHTRNDARRHLRDLVGQSVYEASIPQHAGNVVTAITLRQVSGNTDLPLVGETGLQEDIVELNIWTRGPHSPHNARVIGRIVRIAISNYWGWLDWERTTWAHSIGIERDMEFVSPPNDGSDKWPGYWSMDLSCGYTVAAPVYPCEQLTAIITTTATPTALVISGALSHVPAGRPIMNVAFTVSDSQGGNILKQWTGAPNAIVSGAGLAGLNLEATATGLPATGWIELTVTDKNGTQSTTGVSYGQ